MAGFGLSAFFFTTLSNTLLGSTTSTFLLILALGTSSLILLGFFFVHPVPLPEQKSSQWEVQAGDDIREATLPPSFPHHNHSRTPLLNDNSVVNRYVRTDITANGENSTFVRGDMEAVGQKLSLPLNVHGKALLSNLDFWLLFSISSMRMFPFSFVFFSFHILDYSSWDWLYMYVCLVSF